VPFRLGLNNFKAGTAPKCIEHFHMIHQQVVQGVPLDFWTPLLPVCQLAELNIC